MKTPAPTIRFATTTYTLASQTIARLPAEASEKLPSRGQVAVAGTVNGQPITTVLEPDGYWGHWIRISKDLQQAGIAPGDTIECELTPTKNWPEPTLPQDYTAALADAPQSVKDKWHDITPMARWEWIRWINATANDSTRAIRIEKTISKLAGKHRRPCCFNLAACTDPELSKNSRLIEP